LAAALLTGARATIKQGREPSLLRFSIWRLDFGLRPLVGFRTAWFGYFRPETETSSRARRAVITAAGPATSLLALVVVILLAQSVSYPASWILWAAAGAALVQVAVTVLPIRYGRFFGPYRGMVSDGRRILELLR
jgi:hypothetical protein